MASSIKLFIAQSLDGYIAQPDGNLDWLNNMPNPDNNDHGYTAFIEQIDVVVMGRSTYEEILNFDAEWPYGNCQCFVITSDVNYKTSTPNTLVVNCINESSIQTVVKAGKKDIWIVGGGKVIAEFIEQEAISEMTITTIPVILGEGIPLFPTQKKQLQLELLSSESFQSGAVNNTYRVK